MQCCKLVAKHPYMKSGCRILISFILLFVAFSALAQNESKHFKVAVFAPLYVDSSFDGNVYKLGVGNLPKTSIAGLEFYNGVMMAIDSLQAEGVTVEVLVYDTKNKEESLQNIVSKDELNDVALMIASFNNRAEIKPLADFALLKKIPLISATFPNDGGMTNNPYFVVLNSSLKTHCEELYKYMQRFYATGKITMFTRKGAVESYIQSVFGDVSRSTPAIPLKIKTVQLTDTFSNRNVLDFLDSTRKNIIICGTINDAFALRLTRTLSASYGYQSLIIGMPTWDALKDLDRSDCKGVEMVYSTPYNFSRTDKIGAALVQKYKDKYAARPGDMVFKGFEAMYHFTKLLLAHDTAMIDFVSDKNYKIFSDFDIRAVKNKSTYTIDYRENRKLYFIKKADGLIKSVY